MEQLTSQPEQTTVKPKRTKCNECKRIREIDESYGICHVCYNIKTKLKPKPSGNKVIDDFIRHTQVNYVDKAGKIEYVPYDQFKGIEFIAEGGFSKIYKATWVDGPINNWHDIKRYTFSVSRSHNCTVVLKKLNNSNNITSKELNELKLFYQIFSNNNRCYTIGKYFGITQDPVTKEIMIVMPYYESGDLKHYLTNNFYKINWGDKLDFLYNIINGLANIHELKIVHRDLHSGNIFFSKYDVVIGDLGLSKSATESTNDNENYGIIPYMAPEIFRGQEYTEASDIYSFGMIMWEFMTGRRPFWDKNHDTDLIIEICDGFRPPIVTNAPEGYVELMKECWNSDPKKRPTATVIYDRIKRIQWQNKDNQNPIKIDVESSDIGPVTTNGSGAIYNSRSLRGMIQSAMSIRSSRSLSNNLETDPFYHYKENSAAYKRKFENDSIEDNNDSDNDRSIKNRKSYNDDYITKEIEFDINNQPSNNDNYIAKEIEFDININNQPSNNEYVTKEFDFDIKDLK